MSEAVPPYGKAVRGGEATPLDAVREAAIKAALRAYPSSDLLGADYEKMNLGELLDAARKNEFGDTLVGFLVRELYEGLDGEEPRRETACWRGAELVERAANDLAAVAEELYRLGAEPGKRRRAHG